MRKIIILAAMMLLVAVQAGALRWGGGGDGASKSSIFNTLNTPSQYYRFFIPATQFPGSGNAKDKSGNGADASLLGGLSDANAWANTGYLTTISGTNGAVSIPKAKTSFDLGSQSVILSARINLAIPSGASPSLYTIGDGVSSQGFYLSARVTTGKIRPVLTSSGGVVNGLADSTAVFCDSTDHVVTMAIDAITKSIFLYRDGVLSDSYIGVFSGNTSARATDFFIGAAASGTSYALKTNGIHFLVMNGGLPSNLGLIAQKLSAMPTMFLNDSDFKW